MSITFKSLLKASTIAVALSLASLAQAATIELSPANVSVKPGQTVTVTVTVDPQGTTVAAASAEISYPTGLLTPTSFTFAPNWVGVTQSGYDQMSGGLVIKTAGYPGGITAPTVLGTLTLTASAPGTASVAVASASQVYDSNGADRLSGNQGVSTIAIASGGAAATVGTGSAGATSAGQGEVLGASTSTDSATAAPSASSTTVASTDSQAAAAANALGGNILSSAWLWGLLALIVIALIVWLVLSRRKQP